jgi:hypothetical protein
MKKWLRIAGLLVFVVFLTGCPILNLIIPSEKKIPDGSGGQVLAPQFSVATGTYQSGFELTISCETPGAVIYYSTDVLAELWSGPAYTPILENMEIYSGPLQISGHTTVWACSVKPGMEVSAWRRVDYAIIPDDSANLIGNGDFSLGRTLWWGGVGSGLDAEATISYLNGEFAMQQIQPGSEWWAIGMSYQPGLLVEEGRIYSLSFEAKASQNRHIKMRIGERGRDLNGNGEIYDNYLMGNYELTTDWITFSSEFGMLNPDDDNAAFNFQLGLQHGDVWIRDIQFHVRDPLPFDPDSIPDEQFRLAIAANVDVEVAELTELHLRGLTRFDPLGHPITDLTGIGQLSNLRDLMLWGTALESLNPIIDLGATLEWLHCQNAINGVAMQSMLSILTADNFPNLTGLNLSNAEKMQTDTSTLINLFAGLPVLHAIGLDFCAVDDTDFEILFDEVIDPTKLDLLHLGRNNLTNASLDLIATLTQLKYLDLQNNPVSDITLLASLDRLISLELAYSDITDLEPLRELYDAGAFRTSHNDRNIDIRYNNLDLRPGTDNREVVDYLLDKGVFLRWQEGNFVEGDEPVFTVPTEGLVAEYTMDQVSASLLIDSAGDNDGEIFGAQQVDGLVGSALSFDRSAKDRVRVGVPDVPSGDSPRSISAWIYPSAGVSQVGNIVAWGDGLSYNSRWSTLVIMPGNGNGEVEVVGEGNDVTGPALVPEGVWTHIAATYDGSLTIIYINGTVAASQAPPEGAYDTDPDQPLMIGTNTENRDSEYFSGLIDELRIYDRALSLSEVQGLAGVSITP